MCEFGELHATENRTVAEILSLDNCLGLETVIFGIFQSKGDKAQQLGTISLIQAVSTSLSTRRTLFTVCLHSLHSSPKNTADGVCWPGCCQQWDQPSTPKGLYSRQKDLVPAANSSFTRLQGTVPIGICLYFSLFIIPTWRDDFPCWYQKKSDKWLSFTCLLFVVSLG